MLTRREGEVIVIAPGTPHECRVTVLRKKDGRRSESVSLGFTADLSVEILREELMQKGLHDGD